MSHDRFKSEGPGMQLCRDSAVFSQPFGHMLPMDLAEPLPAKQQPPQGPHGPRVSARN